MSSLRSRTLQNNEIACPNCGGKRCSIHWEGGACNRCDGQGNWKTNRGNTLPCRSCNAGARKSWVKCFRDGKSYDLDPAVAVNAPPVKPSSPRAVDARVDLIYSAFLERCHLSDYWLQHLRTERNLSNDTIERVGFVTLPSQETCNAFAEGMSKTFGPLVGMPGFYEHEGKWCFRRTLPHWESGLVIPYRNAAGHIVMLQVRTNSKDPKKRYMCISGAPPSATHSGTGSSAPAHWTPKIETQTIGITEGGLKAIRIDELWRRFKWKPTRWVGLCGLSVPPGFFDELWAAGARQLLFAFDREVKDSDAWRSVERVRATLRKGAAEWRMRVCEEPGCWKGEERKFDDHLGSL